MTNGKRYKLIALDLDGTLLHADGTPCPRATQAITMVQAAGYRVCIATGRNYTESRAIIRAAGIKDECVFVGGAVVVDTRTETTLHRTIMHPDLAAEACALFESMGYAALALQDTCEAGLDYLITRDLPVSPATTNWIASMKMGVDYVPQLGSYAHRHTLRVSICCDLEQEKTIVPILQQRFGNRTMMHSLRVPGMNCQVVEIFDPAVNKWEGINYIARRHGIAPEEVIAVGDDMNDLHMIRHAGLGVAMGNSRPELKAIARRVIGANSQGGLGLFLEELADGRSGAAA